MHGWWASAACALLAVAMVPAHRLVLPEPIVLTAQLAGVFATLAAAVSVTLTIGRQAWSGALAPSIGDERALVAIVAAGLGLGVLALTSLKLWTVASAREVLRVAVTAWITLIGIRVMLELAFE